MCLFIILLLSTLLFLSLIAHVITLIRSRNLLQLTLTPETKQRLEQLRVLSEKRGRDKIIQHALVVYESLWKERAAGADIVIMKGDEAPRFFHLR